MLDSKYEKAIESFTKALNKAPNDYSKAFSLNYRGTAYTKLGDNEKALSDFDESTKLKPDNPRPYHNRAAIKYYRIDEEDMSAFNFSLEVDNSFKQVEGEDEIKRIIKENIDELGKRLKSQGKLKEIK